MIKTLTAKHKIFQQKFILAWVSTTLAFVLVIIISLWQYTYSTVQQQFNIEAHELSFRLEDIFKDILGSLNAIPMGMDSDFKASCNRRIHEVENIVFSSLYLSGILISDMRSGQLCATEGSLKKLPKEAYLSSEGPVLLGPLTLQFSKQAYYLQKNYRDYLISGFFLKSVLDNLFKKENHFFDFIGLYEPKNKNLIYSIGVNPSSKSFFASSKPGEIVQINASTHCFEAILLLNTVDNVKLVISKRDLGFFSSLSKQILLYLLPLMILSWWFFNYSKRLINKRFSIDHALYVALKEEQFYPVYQPIYDASQDRFMGAEILIRWKTELNETILPKFFIEEAEKSGIIVPITLQLITKVFQECQPMFQKKIPFKLSFNVTPEHFKSKVFLSELYYLCELYAIPPNQITLELTERGLFDNTDGNMAEIMRELRNRGFSLSLDDFGTGQSNINYLQHFPFNYLKIDQIFIKTIGTGAIIESLNQGIINIARSLKLEIIAEGVETEEQVAYLKENNVFFMQGWYYAKAMPYKAFSKLFEKSNKDPSK